MKNEILSIRLKDRSPIPKYKQLANEILKLIKSGFFAKDDMLPSIHELFIQVDVSKRSVEKAYGLLKDAGVAKSVHGIGYFVVKNDIENLSFEQPGYEEVNRLIMTNGEVIYLPRLDRDIINTLRGIASAGEGASQ